MREGWEYKKLGEVCDIYQPKTLATSELIENGRYLVYGANGVIGRFDNYNHEESEVLLTCRGATCGKINVSEPYSWINGNAMVIHRFSDIMSFEYLQYVMHSLDYSMIITGAAQPQITRAKLAPVIIPVPQKTVQRTIVAELDQINDLIRLKKEQLKEYDNLAQSIFYDMFGDPVENEKGWEVKKFCDMYNVSSSKRIYQSELVSYGVPFLKVSDIVNLIDLGGVVPKFFIEENKYDDLKAQKLVPQKGDLLITARGTLGKCYIVKSTDRFYFQDGMVTWLSNKTHSLNPIFVAFIFKQRTFYEYLYKNARHTTIDYISIQQLARMQIPLPPLPLQQEFSSRIEQIEKLKAEIRKTITDLETLLASRMQYWFE